MNERQYYHTKIVYNSVLAFIFCVLIFMPGVDATGQMIVGALGGFMLLQVAYSVWRMKRASAEVAVYTPETLHTAPLDTQLVFWNRARWFLPLALGVLTVMAGYDLQSLERGEAKSVSLLVPFNFVYTAFGAQVTVGTMSACTIGSYFAVQWFIKRVLPVSAAVMQKASANEPENKT